MVTRFKNAFRMVAAIALLLTLGGCIVIPDYGPYYRPYRHYHYR